MVAAYRRRLLRVQVYGIRRDRENSGWLTSMPVSTIVTGFPGPGGVSASTPTAARHHSLGTRGSEKSWTVERADGPVGSAVAQRVDALEGAETSLAAVVSGTT